AARGTATSAARTAVGSTARAAERAAGEDAGAGTAQGAGKTLATACRNSFVAGTMVLLATGALVPITDVHIGDQVQATDPATGKTTAHTVTATYQTSTDTDFTDLTIQDARGNVQTITSTQGHPYWDATRQAFVDAAKLPTGDQLRQPDGTTSTVREVRNY